MQLECTSAVHLMRNKGWETLIDQCVHNGWMDGGRVAGQLWVDVCRKRWTSFSAIVVYAWQTRWFTWGGLKRLRDYNIAIVKAHILLQWGKSLWSHLWIDHMYFFARQGRPFCKLACFAMEGSHRRLKCMVRNSGGLSLLQQVVVDNHTIDESLCREVWGPTKRSMRGQGPISVRLLAALARSKALSDLGYVKALQQRFQARKRRRWHKNNITDSMLPCVSSCGNSPNIMTYYVNFAHISREGHRSSLFVVL